MSHDINPSDAQKFIAEYQQLNNKIEAFCYKKDKIEKILSQKNCEGIRVYYALKPNGETPEKALIIVGIDRDRRDLNAEYAEYIAEYGIPDIDIGSPLV